MNATAFGSQGFDQLDRMLGALASGVPEPRLREVLHEGAALIVQDAQRLAPVDTGLLRDSIRAVDDRDARIYGKVNSGGISLYVGPVGSTEEGDVFYARFVEFGTVFQAAQPFMRNAIAAKRPEAERLIATRLMVEVRSLADDA